MIVAFSTSSPQASVALFKPSGELLIAKEQLAAHHASGALLAMLDECLRETNRTLEEATGFTADLGPGSFVGARVAVVMAKTLSLTTNTKAAGMPAWRLIGTPQERIAIPNKRNEFFLFQNGIFTLEENPQNATGYGPGFEPHHYPHAAQMPLDELNWMQPEMLVPFYAVEPNISLPKTPYREAKA